MYGMPQPNEGRPQSRERKTMPASLAGRPFKSIQYCAMSALDRKVPRSFGPESYRHTANGRVGSPPVSPALTTPLLLKSSRRAEKVTVRYSSGPSTGLSREPKTGRASCRERVGQDG